jgi:hypothetical protein
MDPDPDPAIFVIDLQVANKKQFVSPSFSAYHFLTVHETSFLKDKKS